MDAGDLKTAALQRVQTWGNSKVIDITAAMIGTGFSPNLPTGQIVNVQASDPVAWLVQWTIDTVGFATETNPINVTLITQVGVGQALQNIRQTVSLSAPNYAESGFGFFDQGQVPASSLNISAQLTGGPLLVAADHQVTVGVSAAPFTGHQRKVIEDLLVEQRALRGELQAFRQLQERLAPFFLAAIANARGSGGGGPPPSPFGGPF